jgi:hypothetical protein
MGIIGLEGYEGKGGGAEIPLPSGRDNRCLAKERFGCSVIIARRLDA